MDGSRSVVAGVALTIALVAIALGLLVILAPAAPAPPSPSTIDLSLVITGQGALGGPARSHLYDPQMIVVRGGDTVRIRTVNQSFYRHAIEIAGYGVRTGPLTGGEHASEVLTFVADRPGIFVYRCYLPHDPATATCAPDHDTMIGHLVVLDGK